MHILFLTDNFPPETNAPATRTFEHARRWVTAGHRVTIITCVPNFPGGQVFSGYRNRLIQREKIAGIEVIRVWTYITANEGFLRRSLDYISFMVAAIIAGLFLKRPDVIIATSPQFFAAIGGYLLSILKWRPFVFELRDLWPDSIVAVGAMGDTLLIKLLRRIEYFLYRRATLIVSVTNSFKDILVKNGITANKIVVIPNGVDTEEFKPGARPPELLAQWKLEGKFIAAYVGTLGMAHGLGTLLNTAKVLRDHEKIAFVLVGAGAERTQLIERARMDGLENVYFVGAVDKETVKQYWRLADVALVLLRDIPLFAHVIPSKMFEAMGTAKPIILGVRGESKNILERANAGIAITPEDTSELVAAILRLVNNPAEAADMGNTGRTFVEIYFDRDRLAVNMLRALQQVNNDNKRK